MNITLDQTARNINQKQQELNKSKCGSSYWFYYTHILNFDEINISDGIFINANSMIGKIEIDNHKFLVESSIYLSKHFDIFSNSIVKKSNSGDLSFSLFLKQAKTNYDSSSISEIYIFTDRSIYNFSTYLFFFVSILL